jgi:DNA-binding NarL/FixJ family response regulator
MDACAVSPTGEPVAVLTVDDQALFHAVAREVIEATPGFESVGEASSGAEAMRMVGERRPQLVLMDVRMPDMDGMEAARCIKQDHPDTVVVLISVDPAQATPDSCGAEALVSKQRFGPALLRDLWLAHGRSSG